MKVKDVLHVLELSTCRGDQMTGGVGSDSRRAARQADDGADMDEASARPWRAAQGLGAYTQQWVKL